MNKKYFFFLIIIMFLSSHNSSAQTQAEMNQKANTDYQKSDAELNKGLQTAFKKFE